MKPLLDVHKDGACWTLLLNRPEKMNAISHDLVEHLFEAVEDARSSGVELLILRGEGKSFSAGFDFGDIDNQSDGDLLLRFVRIEELLQAVSAYPGMTLALAHGRVFGAGVDLFAACKWRCATPDAKFRMPGLKFGIVLGSDRFAQIVGVETARGILETARMFDAQEAKEIGFVHRLCQADAWPELIAEAQGAARELPASSRIALYQRLNAERSWNADRDLAHLVRSAARPDLRKRILTYLNEAKSARSANTGT